MLFFNNVAFSILQSNNDVIYNTVIYIIDNNKKRVKFPVLGNIILVIIAFDHSFWLSVFML